MYEYKSKVFSLREFECRICNGTKEEGGASFSKKAHVIPHFLGGKLLTNNECDDCNRRSGEIYEHAFDQHLSPIRPYVDLQLGLRDKKIKFGNEQFIQSHEGRIEVQYDNIKHPDFGVGSGVLGLERPGKKWRTVNVYKCLVKMSIMSMPDEWTSLVSQACKWLKDFDFLEEVFREKKLPKIAISSLQPSVVMEPTIATYVYRGGLVEGFPEVFSELSFGSYSFIFIVPFTSGGLFHFDSDEKHHEFLDLYLSGKRENNYKLHDFSDSKERKGVFKLKLEEHQV